MSNFELGIIHNLRLYISKFRIKKSLNQLSYFNRSINSNLSDTLLDTPIILLSGNKQAGKTKLVKEVVMRKQM